MTHEITSTVEGLKRQPRYVVFGTSFSSRELVKQLETETLKNPEGDVQLLTDARHIEDGFFGRFTKPIIDTIQPGLGQRILAGVLGRPQPTPTYIRSPKLVTAEFDTLPRAVIILPEMCQRDFMGHGMTIPTPLETIQALCDEHDVTALVLEAQPSEEQITKTLRLIEDLPTVS
jgi:hypothetical protein